MAANKRPTRSTTKDREKPLIRSSHAATRSDGPKPAKRAAAGPKAVKAARRDVKATLKKAKAPAEPRSLGGSPSSRAPTGLSTASDEAREVAVLVATAAIEKKASGLEVIDVAGRVDYADFLVLMSGRSDRHVAALSSAIEEALRKRNKRALAVEGLPVASWVLMDFGDVVVHVFQDDARAAYDIDGLWMDARRVPVPLSEPRA